MAVTVTVTDNLDEVLHLFDTATSKALAEIGMTVREGAADGSPVRTGALRKAFVFEVNDSEKWVKIGVPMDALKGNYAKYVELGTSKGQIPRHMLANSVNANIDQFPNIVKVEMENA